MNTPGSWENWREHFVKQDRVENFAQKIRNFARGGFTWPWLGSFASGSIMLNFLILAFIIFQMVRMLHKAKRTEPAPTAEATPTPEDIMLLREIRDALKK